jgi:DNA-directed RNA polymerase subunit M/transcription elongation factor TFIIS
MNFCPVCKFMVYTKLAEDTTKLSKYCKNCGWSGDIDKLDKCVYSHNYSDDFIAQRMISNKYTLYDPTLPRVSSIKCINDSCMTNKVGLENALKISIPQSVDTETVTNEIVKLGVKSVEIFRINNKSMGITFANKEDLESGKTLINLLEIEGEKVKISELTKVDREIIFIKFDNSNMKYLYMCSTCGTSWKTN